MDEKRLKEFGERLLKLEKKARDIDEALQNLFVDKHTSGVN